MLPAQSKDATQVFSPTNLRLLATLSEALTEPRNNCYWHAPKEIPLTSPNGEPIGALVWCSFQSTYRFETADTNAP